MTKKRKPDVKKIFDESSDIPHIFWIIPILDSFLTLQNSSLSAKLIR